MKSGSVVSVKKDSHLRILFTNFLRSFKSFFSALLSNPRAVTGSIIMILFLFMVVVLRRVMPYNSTPNPEMILARPSVAHPLGCDEMGRDLLRRIIAGSESIFLISLFTGIFTVTLGVILGLIAGLAGGFVDRAIMFVANLFLTVPNFPIMLALAQILTISNSILFALILSVWSWAGLARAIRAQIVSLKERDFIQICKVMNLPRHYVLFGELLPNILSYIVVNFVLVMRSAITASVGIMMLGVAAYDHTNWGAMLNSAQGYIINPNALMLWLSPIIFIVIYQAGAVLLSNGLDQVLNPRLRRL
ncbi:MAG: Glutathione transport system permease protein GsiD [Tenericutes bacterium ADurb.Bin239]|nr:MAG: Glutathione transport system permease protein GsiD [Tenericutes bacterium ADurb.Bin239]